jgi:hypothetical protein
VRYMPCRMRKESEEVVGANKRRERRKRVCVGREGGREEKAIECIIRICIHLCVRTCVKTCFLRRLCVCLHMYLRLCMSTCVHSYVAADWKFSWDCVMFSLSLSLSLSLSVSSSSFLPFSLSLSVSLVLSLYFSRVFLSSLAQLDDHKILCIARKFLLSNL